jgi:hypothetical protein
LEKVKKNTKSSEEVIMLSQINIPLVVGSDGIKQTKQLGTLCSDSQSTINLITKMLAEWVTEPYPLGSIMVDSTTSQPTPTQT